MSRFPLAALLLFSLAATPAGAMQFDFARDGIVAEIETAWPSDYVVPHTSLRIGTMTTAGGLELAFDELPLSELAARYGGTIQRFANAGYDTQWLCYRMAGQRIWYFTGGAPEEMNGGRVSWIVMEEADPDHDADYGCSTQPLALLLPGGRVPALGMSRSEVESLYDAELPAADRYVTLFQDAYEEPFIVTNITLRFTEDRVSGISIAEGEAY